MTSGAGDWVTRPLGDLVDVLDSKRIPVSAKERAGRPGTVPYYGATGPVGTIDLALFNEDLLLLGEDGVQFFDPNKPKAYRIRGPAWVNNHAHVLRPRRDRVGDRFLLHFLNQADYRGFANGTTRLKLTQGAMLQMPITLPSIEEQGRIVDLLEDHLSRLDAGTKTLHSVVARAEGLRSAVRHHMFEDLKAKSGLTPLLSVSTIANGQTPKGVLELVRSDPLTGTVPYFKVGDMNASDGRWMNGARNYIAREAAASLGLAIRPTNTVLIPKRGGAIATNKKRILREPACFDLNTMGLVAGDHLDATYLWHWLQSVDLGLIADGSNVPQINAPQIRRLALPVPDLESQRSTSGELDGLDQTVDRLRSEASTAVRRSDQLRRTLMGAAFSGQLRPRTSAKGGPDV